MVFLAVGTQKQDFSRLFKLVENSKSLKDEEIIAQAGYTKYTSNKIKIKSFLPKENILNQQITLYVMVALELFLMDYIMVKKYWQYQGLQNIKSM